MDEGSDDFPHMDEADQQWINTFIGGERVPAGSVVQGFTTIISFIDPQGNNGWDVYNTIDAPLSHILGLMTMAQFKMMHDNYRVLDE